MVRVIPVHNFLGQSVAAVEEPTASCTATYMGQEMLLLALSSHCVEVHQLSMTQPKVTTVFPTVDLVHQMLHCNTENYIATVESKCSRDGTNVNNFVRIYVNWALGGNQNQAMRARIAGRVTPSSNRLSTSLEMIELPLSGQPTRIACCQATGNLLVATGDTAVLHELKVERQQLSKQKFIDFEARPWSLGFSFSPTHMKIAEDFFMIQDAANFMVFRLMNQLYEDIDLLSSSNSARSSSSRKTSSFNVSSLHTIATETRRASEASLAAEKSAISTEPTYQSLDSAETFKAIEQRNANASNANQSTKAWNSSVPTQPVVDDPTYIEWDRLVSNKSEEQLLVSHKLMSEKSQSFCVELPSLKSESNKPGPISNPFISNAPELTVVIKTSSPMDGWSENYVVKSLLQLKISKAHRAQRASDNSDYFTCCLLKPIYLKSESNAGNAKKCTLRSDKYRSLNGVCCVICTTQEGYLFHFNVASSKNTSCTPYPFTAPVSRVVLEDTVLHALTEAGLESYTLRLSHCVSNAANNSPENLRANDAEPVSLIGLRPFMGVQRLLHVNRYIVLLTQADDHWTLYTLSLPSPEDLYYDVINAAINHKVSSPSTYKHLLNEAFMIVSLAKDVDYCVPDNMRSNRSEANNSTSPADLEVLYRKSCALLADYYINSESPLEWYLCIPYFKKSRLKPSDILAQKSMSSAPGLATYLTDTLMNLKSGAEADALFQVHNVVEMISSTSKKNLIKLIFSSLVLREYATEKLIGILQSLEQDDATKFALVLLYVQADRQEQAEKTIKSIADSCISSMSLTHWHCLFDVTLERQSGHVIATFSELSVILMRQKSLVFADVLVRVIDAKAVSLHQTLQIFLAHLPSRVGRDGHVAAAVLQLFVETYLRNYFDSKGPSLGDPKRNEMHYDYSIVEAFKILVRSYLGKLTQTNVYTIEENRNASLDVGDESEYLFEKLRPQFLDKMRSHATSAQEAKNSAPAKTKRREKVRNEALKLQALLASGYLPAECLQEVEEFLKAHKVDGDLTFRLLCVGNIEGTQMLMDNCPQALLEYAKESYTEESEWKYLIQLLYDKISAAESNSEVSSLLDQLLEETLIHLARTMSLKGLQLLLSNDNTTILQRYGDICSQIMHADHVNSMIIGTGQHLLVNINV